MCFLEYNIYLPNNLLLFLQDIFNFCSQNKFFLIFSSDFESTFSLLSKNQFSFNCRIISAYQLKNIFHWIEISQNVILKQLQIINSGKWTNSDGLILDFKNININFKISELQLIQLKYGICIVSEYIYEFYGPLLVKLEFLEI